VKKEDLASAVPCKRTIHGTVEKYWTRGLFKANLETLFKPDDIGARNEIRPRKVLSHLAIQSGLSKSSASRVTKLLKIFPCNIEAVKHIFSLYWEAGSLYCGWFDESVTNWFPDLVVMLFPNKTCLTSNKSVNCQKKRIFFPEYLLAVHEFS
jgi:hypothetical protein